MKYLKIFENYNNYEDIKTKLSTIHIDNLTEEDIGRYIQLKGHNGFTEETDEEMCDRIWSHIKTIQKLNQSIVLYRVLSSKNIENINTDIPGVHYILNPKTIDDVFLYDIGITNIDNLYLLTIKTDKKRIDIVSMIDTNMNYKHEEEITLNSNHIDIPIEVINIRKFKI